MTRQRYLASIPTILRIPTTSGEANALTKTGSIGRLMMVMPIPLLCLTALTPIKKELGSVVDRIGHPKGSYLGGIPDGGSPASFEARAVDPSSLHDRYYQYEFTENQLPDGWTIETGTAAKWKQMPGGAPQLRILDENGDAVSIWRLLGGEEDGFTQIAPILQGKKDPIPFKFNKRGN